MRTEDYEELIQTEAERVAEDLFGTNYYDLEPELRLRVRAQVIKSLWAEYANDDIATAA